MLAREDAHPALFDAYAETLVDLSGNTPLDETLRRFEWQLLRETGHAPALNSDAAGAPIQGASRYRWTPSAGFVVAEPGAEQGVAGTTLMELAAGKLASLESRSEAKYLARAILSHQLDGHPLRTRQILIDLHKLSP